MMLTRALQPKYRSLPGSLDFRHRVLHGREAFQIRHAKSSFCSKNTPGGTTIFFISLAKKGVFFLCTPRPPPADKEQTGICPKMKLVQLKLAKLTIDERLLFLSALFLAGMLQASSELLPRRVHDGVVFPNFEEQVLNDHKRTLKSIVDTEAKVLAAQIKSGSPLPKPRAKTPLGSNGQNFDPI